MHRKMLAIDGESFLRSFDLLGINLDAHFSEYYNAQRIYNYRSDDMRDIVARVVAGGKGVLACLYGLSIQRIFVSTKVNYNELKYEGQTCCSRS
jgi:hypothetical protein